MEQVWNTLKQGRPSRKIEFILKIVQQLDGCNDFALPCPGLTACYYCILSMVQYLHN